MNKILTSPSSIGQISQEPFDLLKSNGYEIINNPLECNFTVTVQGNKFVRLLKNF